MGKYKKLAKNTVIFLIGNAGTKLLLFLLVSVCTFYFSTEAYGTYDIITQIINLMLPFSILGTSEAVLRFTLDKAEINIKVLYNTFIIVFIGLGITVIASPLLRLYSVVSNYVFLIAISIIFQAIYTILHQYTKGISRNWVYIISDLIEAVVQLGLSFIFLNLFKDKIIACVVAMLVGYTCAIVYNIILVDFSGFFSKNNYDRELIGRLVAYSVPLMPNSILWWVTGMSDRFIVQMYTGLAAVGLYSVASKIPSMITTFTSVVFQAWQISAVEEYESADKSVFFSIIMDLCISFIFILIAAISYFIKPITSLLVSNEFFNAWRYIPLLLIATFFSSIQSFIGTNYMASKKTLGALGTTAFGAISNIVMNFALIPRYGVVGAIIATILSYAIVTVARYFGTKKYVNIIFNWKIILPNCLLISFIYYKIYTGKYMIDPIGGIFLFVVVIFDCFNIIKLLKKVKTH